MKILKQIPFSILCALLVNSAFAMEYNFDDTKTNHEEDNVETKEQKTYNQGPIENMVTTSLKLCRTGRDASDVARLLLSSAEHVSKDMPDRSPKLTINSDPIVVSGFCEEKNCIEQGPRSHSDWAKPHERGD